MESTPKKSTSSDVELSDEEKARQYEHLMHIRHRRDAPEALNQVRRLILLVGIPPPRAKTEPETLLSTSDDTEDPARVRAPVWQALLRAGKPNAQAYYDLVQRGPSKAHDIIVNDTFRTFHKSKEFTSRVPVEMLIRGLNAYVHSKGNIASAYVQGLNAQLAPFLFTMDEVSGFYCFSRFVTVHCPQYSVPDLSGVHEGCKLLDQILPLVDEELAMHLKNHGLTARIYAFPSILSLSSCTPPLTELVQLWDLFLAFGIHLNVLCVAAQLMLMRDEILASESPMRLLRKFPDLDAALISSLTVQLVRQVPSDVFDALVQHPIREGTLSNPGTTSVVSVAASASSTDSAMADLT